MRCIPAFVCVRVLQFNGVIVISYRLLPTKKVELMWTSGITLNETATTRDLTAILTCGR